MDQYLPTLIQAVATTSAIVTAVVFYWRRTLFSPSIFRSSVPNDLVDWIDQGSFEVAAAICDTLLPSHDESVVDQRIVQFASSFRWYREHDIQFIHDTEYDPCFAIDSIITTRI